MKMKKSLTIAAAAVCGLFLTVQSVFAQGSLTPSGAPAPTMKTLTQVEPRTPISSLPYTITNPGSYYLTTNLTGMPGPDGIDINANDVTLDLNGFTLQGMAGSGSGINAINPVGNLAIRNGVVDSWVKNGVNAANSYNSQLERLRVSNCNTVNNDNWGGLSAGSNCVVLVCTANGNKQSGFIVGENCIIKDCTASGSLIGIVAGNNATVSHCTAALNSGTPARPTDSIESKRCNR
jgi:hypothetical protein